MIPSGEKAAGEYERESDRRKKRVKNKKVKRG